MRKVLLVTVSALMTGVLVEVGASATVEATTSVKRVVTCGSRRGRCPSWAPCS